VAHAYNPSHSGGRDQEDRGLKPAGQIDHKTPITEKKTLHKKSAGRVAQSVGPEFKHQYCKKKKKKKNQKVPHEPVIPLLRISPKEIKLVCQRDISTPMFIVAQFTTAKK
jgi:hypothetical protein